mmetsp:Transcript_85994/g.251673  ORF Transcript_85994/g.251673 Transcript_85994/m.251673 type:complete len:88 (-) Transcript_85994:8-271(-)
MSEEPQNETGDGHVPLHRRCILFQAAGSEASQWPAEFGHVRREAMESHYRIRVVMAQLRNWLESVAVVFNSTRFPMWVQDLSRGRFL